MSKKLLALSFTLVMILVALTGCSEKKRDSVIMGYLEQNVVETDSTDYFITNNPLFGTGDLPDNFEMKTFPSMSSLLLELGNRSIDYIFTAHCIGEYLAAQDDKLTCVEDKMDLHYHMATRAEDSELNAELSDAIDAMKTDGSLDKLIAQYITGANDAHSLTVLTKKPDGETHVVGVTGDLPPMDYVASDGTPAGFNVALLNAISERTGCNFEIVQVDAKARLSALSSKRIDIVFWNGCTVTGNYEPTSDEIALSSAYFEEKACYVTRDYPVEKIKEIYSLDQSAQTEKTTVGVLEQNSIEEAARIKWLQKIGVSDKSEYIRFSSLSTMLLELKADRVDSLRLPKSVSQYLVSLDDTLLTVQRNSKIHYHMATRSEDTDLCEELSAAFDVLKADGTMETLIEDYITNTNGDPAHNQLVHHEGADTHIVAVTGDMPPLDFVAADGTPAGFNVALLNAISEKTGCNFEILQMDAAARLSALTSKKADLIFWIDCQSNGGNEPEQEGVSLTEPYFEENICYASYSQEFLPQPSATGQRAQ